MSMMAAMITRTKLTSLCLLLLLVLAFAGQPMAIAAGGHAQGAEGEHEAQAAAGHDEHGTGEALVFTHYTDTTELFVEFPPLVVGQPSTLAAHVTRLSDAAPLTSGIMDVHLRQQGKTVARFRVRQPARKGIFTPAVTPRTAGQYEFVVEVRDGDLHATHNLGEVTVFADAASVHVDQRQPEGDISYLKEQQWDNPFAITRVAKHAMRPSVPGFATVKAPADGSAIVRAPSDGYFSSATLISAGDTINTDTMLGYLVPRLGEGTDIGSIQVEIQRARSKVELARRDVERLRGLYEQGAIPERRLTEARQDLEVARVELQTARSRLQQRSGASTKAGIALRAPIDGEVVSVNVRPGAFVRAGDVLFTLADPARRWLEVYVPEKFALNIRSASGAWLAPEVLDSEQTVVLDADNQARVVNINTVINETSRTAAVTVEYPSDKGPTLIGARYPAHVLYGQPRARLAIPRSAIIDDGGQAVVYVQTGGETFTRRSVRLGIVDGGKVEVLDGVNADEWVVSRGAYYVKLASTGGDKIGHGHAH